MTAQARTAPPPRLRFQASQRLRSPGEFQHAFKQGTRLSNTHFSANTVANPLGHPRLGLAIAARTIGNAVQRNRLKRLLRENFRRLQHELPPVDLVISARPAARTASAADLRASAEQLLRRAGERCAS